MSARTLVPTLLLAALASTACGEHKFEPPSQEERVAQADSLYSQALFDSLTWASDSVRVQAGNLVYADECRRCHGALGRAGTPYDAQHDLAVPSLVEPDWRLANDLDGVRRIIFVGHVGGMPNWGVSDLTPRDIDAVAYYVLHQLRPDALSDSLSLPELR